jgi:hypothetical protein
MELEVVWNGAIDRQAAVAGQRPPVMPCSGLKRRIRAWMAMQADDFTSREMAAALGISTDTAASYCSKAFHEGVLTRTERTQPQTHARNWLKTERRYQVLQ